MLHSTFKVRRHHPEGDRCTLAATHMASVLICDVDGAWRVMCIDHASAWLLHWRLLFYCPFPIRWVIVARRPVISPTVVLVMVSDYRRTIHNWVLVAHFFDGRELLQNVNGHTNTYIELEFFVRRQSVVAGALFPVNHEFQLREFLRWQDLLLINFSLLSSHFSFLYWLIVVFLWAIRRVIRIPSRVLRQVVYQVEITLRDRAGEPGRPRCKLAHILFPQVFEIRQLQ